MFVKLTNIFLFCICPIHIHHDHPLLALATQSARISIVPSSQKAYRSAWNKWEKFLAKYIDRKMMQHDYQKLQEQELLRQLLMQA